MFFEYGDDSVAQLGGVHLACEQASNLLTKVLEWGRLMATSSSRPATSPTTPASAAATATTATRRCSASPLGTRYVGDMDRLFDTYADARARSCRLRPRAVPEGPAATPTSSTGRRSGPRRSTRCAASCRRRRCRTSASTAPARPSRRCCCACAPTRCPRRGSYAELMLDELRKVIPSFLHARRPCPTAAARGATYLAETRATTRRELVDRLFAGDERRAARRR